ncbi:hypothetical protein LOK49_LG01G01201 [Camellia lanceoleosa]|uniref:Uncharacterized protein n=1 Tax=Camellia lanceoleosa TaxID=1840588 RepID=A0ACC0J0L8_9ERIC|nr:hypothetical protein LOK49_LG01G01201 [Camellia lanceoleosa]
MKRCVRYKNSYPTATSDMEYDMHFLASKEPLKLCHIMKMVMMMIIR